MHANTGWMERYNYSYWVSSADFAGAAYINENPTKAITTIPDTIAIRFNSLPRYG